MQTAEGTQSRYTAEEYLNSEAPYFEIWQKRANAFECSRALEMAARDALAVGVRNFKSLYKAYEKAQSARVVADNSTDAQGQLMELACGDWVCDDLGVRRGNGVFEEVACQIPVQLTHRYENIDTGAEKVELSFRKGGYWRRLIIPCSQYASPKELVKLSDAGLPVNLRMAQSLSDYLMDLYALNYDRIPASQSVGRLGWVSDREFSPLVDGIVYDGGAEYAPMFSAVSPHGSGAAWIEAAREFRRESLSARIVLAASFASVLVKPLGLLPFFVHLWGVDSSTGKTVALMMAASVWACPEMGKFVKTFDGTDVGYERTAAFLNSLPLCLDELQLSKNARGQVVFNVYRLAQGAGRTRGNRGGGVDVTPTWANAMITTGETPINAAGSGAGAVNRVIEIECTSRAKVVQDGHAVAQTIRQHYGHAGRDFIRRLLENDGSGIEEARRLYEAAFAKLNSSETTDKQAMAAAVIVAADELATKWIFVDGNALTAEDISSFLASREAVSAGARGYEYMCDWVAQNVNRLRPGIENGDVYGLIEEPWAYINSSVFRAAAESGGFNPAALVSFLQSNGLLHGGGGGKHTTIVKRIAGTPTRCICMKLCNSDNFPQEINENFLLP